MPKLNVTTKAPNFTAQTPGGRTVSLSDFSGRPVWLIFYRYAACPLCNLHICDIYFRYEKHANSDFAILGVFETAADSFPVGAPHPLTPEMVMIADPDKKIYEQYGTEKSLLGVAHPKVAVDLARAAFNGIYQGAIEGELGQLPAHFLITPKGDIETAFYGRHIDDHIAWEQVDQFVDKYTPQSKKTTA